MCYYFKCGFEVICSRISHVFVKWLMYISGALSLPFWKLFELLPHYDADKHFKVCI